MNDNMTRAHDIKGSTIAVSFAAAPHAVAAAAAMVMAGSDTPTPADRPPLAGQYIVETKGKTAEAIAAEITALGVYHAAKSARIYDGQSLVGSTLVIDGDAFTWTCITIRERGTDAELYADLVDATQKRPAPMPLKIVRATIADLPNNDELTSLVVAAILAERKIVSDAAAHIARLQTLLGGTP